MPLPDDHIIQKLRGGQVIRRLRRRLERSFRRRLEQRSRRNYVIRRLERPTPPSVIKDNHETILFFSPEAGFKASCIMQSVLGRILKEQGHSVAVARCFGLFERCPAIDMLTLPYVMSSKDKTKVCVDCAATSFEMLDDYGLETLDLKAQLTPEVQSKYVQACANLPDDLITFEYESIPFGKLCLHDLVLATKFSDFEQIGQKLRLGWEAYIKTSLLSFLLTDRICQEFSISRILHVNNYSLQFGAHFAARKHNIPAYSLSLASHQAVDYGRYIVLPELIWPGLFRQGKAWPHWRNLALSETRINEIGDDILVRLGAGSSHVYSPPKNVDVKDIRVKLGLSTSRKLVVAYTSSLDELLALGALKESVGIQENELGQPFADQIEWLHQVIDFIAAREDLQLVVRVHPREGANKRDSITSQHLLKLQKAFGHDIPNCRFVWPQEPISSYDLGEAADLVLTSGSTIGLELARLGAPVLTSASGDTPTPHDDFREFGETPKAFFDKFLKLLDRPTSIETIAHAFRWYNLFHLGTSVDLSDLIPRHDSVELPPFRLPAEAETIEKIIIGGEHPLKLNYERLLAAQRPESVQRERQALEAQLRRAIHFLYTGQDSPEPVPLFMADAAVSEDEEHRLLEDLGAHARIIILEGSQTRYLANRRAYSRYSPMCARLAYLCAERIGHGS